MMQPLATLFALFALLLLVAPAAVSAAAIASPASAHAPAILAERAPTGLLYDIFHPGPKGQPPARPHLPKWPEDELKAKGKKSHRDVDDSVQL